MDSLDDLPVAQTVLSPKEEASLKRLFQEGPPASHDSSSSSNIKLALMC